MAAKLLSEPIDDEELLYSLARVIRQAMNDDKLAEGEFVKKSQILPKMDALLVVPTRKIQYEVVWAVLSAAVFSANCDELVKLGSHRKLTDLINPGDSDLTEECIWAIKNIIDGNPATRDDLLKTELLPKFLSLLSSPSVKKSVHILLFHVLRQLSEILPLPSFAHVLFFIVVFKKYSSQVS